MWNFGENLPELLFAIQSCSELFRYLNILGQWFFFYKIIKLDFIHHDATPMSFWWTNAALFNYFAL